MNPTETGPGAGKDKPSAPGARMVAGSRIGPYRVLKLLGEGGMGTVYLGEHEMIGRKAAIKLLNAEVSTDQESVSRFFTEARAVNQIRHPNIVEVTDFGSLGARPYIVMEYLEGETLGDRLLGARILDVPSTVHIIRQVASALGAAHVGGTVHRDLKPANIFLRAHPDYPDFVKVLDFGIAKMLTPDKDVSHHTRAGSLIGTPSYMSPEQCLGEESLDHRSDIYSLGVVTYLLLTGRLPFQEASLGRLIMAHVNDVPVAPSSLAPQISRAMSAVILKAMAKKPQDRFQTMKDFKGALDDAAGFERTPPPVLRSANMPSSMILPAGRAAPAPIPRPAAPVPPPAARVAVARPRTPTPSPIPGTAAMAAPTVVASSASSASSAWLPQAQKDVEVFARLTILLQDRLARGNLELPQLSAASAQCLETLRSPEFAFGKLAAGLAQEPQLASRIVRLANSAAFQSRSPATSLEQAVGRLGAAGLQLALIEYAARSALEAKDPKLKEAFRAPWMHAVATGLVAEKIMQQLGQPELAGPVYLAALVHDVGKPIVGNFLLGVERQTTGARGARWMSDEVWLRATGSSFRKVSVEVAKAWHLPPSSVTAIERAEDYQPDAGRQAGAVLRYALALAAREGYYLRRPDLDEAAATITSGRQILGVDEKFEAKLVLGLKQTVAQVAGLRGAP